MFDEQSTAQSMFAGRRQQQQKLRTRFFSHKAGQNEYQIFMQ